MTMRDQSPLPEPNPGDQPPKLGLDDQQYRAALLELLERIDTLPREHRTMLAGLVDETRARHDRLRETVARLQETLDTLRVSMKYLIFDVEATRRENEHLRKLIAEQEGE